MSLRKHRYYTYSKEFKSTIHPKCCQIAKRNKEHYELIETMNKDIEIIKRHQIEILKL